PHVDPIDFTTLPSGDEFIEFHLHLHKATPTDWQSLPFNFDVGLPGLGLDMNAGLQVKAGWDTYLGFGVSAKDGFFVDTVAKNANGAPTGTSLMSIHAEASLQANSSSHTLDNGQAPFAKGQIGFLQIEAAPIDPLPTDANGKLKDD